MTASESWHEGDLIKNPDNQQFNIYSQSQMAFSGTLTGWDYTQMYMVFASTANTIRLTGDRLTDADRKITVRGDGQWSVMLCLFNEVTSVTEAMADYYNSAITGDLIKARDRFAVFSVDKRWIGDLTALRPGEGYLFRRMGQGDVDIRFYSQSASSAPQKVSAFSGKGATNMTMICSVSGLEDEQASGLEAYIGDELAGVAEPIEIDNELLYFLTISSDQVGELRFETADGRQLTASGQKFAYKANDHHGSLQSPVLLTPAEKNGPYKIIEDDHVIIIRDGERYDVTGIRLAE